MGSPETHEATTTHDIAATHRPTATFHGVAATTHEVAETHEFAAALATAANLGVRGRDPIDRGRDARLVNIPSLPSEAPTKQDIRVGKSGKATHKWKKISFRVRGGARQKMGDKEVIHAQ